MKQEFLKVTQNRQIAPFIYEMKLKGDLSAITAPGQFVNLKLNGFYLRRPISVCDCSGDTLTLIYKTVGEGTRAMSEIKEGEIIDTLVGLGNGFNTEKSTSNPVLIGGGVGVPPMYMLCKRLIEQNKQVSVILGFNKKEEIFYEQEFLNLGARVFITTVDGSYGIKGYVTDALKTLEYGYFYTCGPMAMFKAIEGTAKTSGQYSFEERMGCGFGACMGCSCKTKYGNKRICKDGPVLEREEIIW